MENPWNIQSIYELQYFNCPSCVFKNHSKQELINHAYEFHPESVDYLMNIDDKSLIDIILPWDVTNKPIKIEENKEDSLDIGNLVYVKTEVFDEELVENVDAFDIKQTDSVNNECSNNYDQIFSTLPKSHTCEACGQIFDDISKLETHIYHECNTFGKVFLQRFQLNSPVKPVTEKLERYKCDRCDKMFGYICHLKRHIKTVHEQVKNHKCETCGKMFGHSSHLRSHIKTVHEGQKEHKCETCGKMFGHLSHLMLHVKTIHLGHRDHKCEICGKEFGQAGYLRTHIKTIHEGQKDFGCDTCGKKFNRNSHLKRHIAYVHEGQKDPCLICGKGFSDPRELKRHIDKEHEGQKC